MLDTKTEWKWPLTIVDGIAKGHFLWRVAADNLFLGAEGVTTPLGALDWSLWSARRTGQCPDPSCRTWYLLLREQNTRGPAAERIARFFMPGRKKRDISTETPQHYHAITFWARSQLSYTEKLRFLCFIPYMWKLFVWNPILKTVLPYGRLRVQKGDTQCGKNTCRLGFPNLPFYINANRERKLKNMNAAEGIPTKLKVRSILQKARLPNDWTQGKEMTPDGCRGSFLCGLHPSGSLSAGTAKRPEKSDPTQLSYHSHPCKSTARWPVSGKICALHKNGCLYLGNIPSWKVKKSVLSYSHKEEILKQ